METPDPPNVTPLKKGPQNRCQLDTPNPTSQGFLGQNELCGSHFEQVKYKWHDANQPGFLVIRPSKHLKYLKQI